MRELKMVNLKSWVVQASIITALGVIVMLGLVFCSTYSKFLRDTTPVTLTGNTIAALAGVGNFTAVGTTQYPYLQTLTGCINASNGNSFDGLYTLVEGDTSKGGVIQAAGTDSWTGNAVNCTGLTYLAASTYSAYADKFSSGLAIFATMIGIVAMAVVGRAVIKLFSQED